MTQMKDEEISVKRKLTAVHYSWQNANDYLHFAISNLQL
jgi:hypothetical protein